MINEYILGCIKKYSFTYKLYWELKGGKILSFILPK